MSDNYNAREATYKPGADGPSPFGSHYLGSWHRCHRLHFYENGAPHPDGGIGLRPRDLASPLLIGLLVHKGLEVLRQHHHETGTYDTARACTAMDEAAAGKRAQAPDHIDDDLAKATALVLRYYDFWLSPDATAPEGEFLQLMVDDKGPVIEREYWTPIEAGGRTFYYTCRVDALVHWHGFAAVLEYKTTDVSYVGRLFSQAGVNAQMTGEVLTLRRAKPDLDVSGVVIDALVKRAAADPKKGQVAHCRRDLTPRTEADLEQFESLVVYSLDAIEQAYREWRDDCAGGVDPWRSAQKHFPTTGMTNNNCYAYNRPCSYMSICKEPGRETRACTNFRARTPAEEKFKVRPEDAWER